MEDNKINSLEELDAHGKYTQAYVDILNTYREQISSSIKNKNTLKNNFFKLIQGIMITLVVLFCASVVISFAVFIIMIIFNYQSVAVITGAIAGMLSTFSTMILSIFKLPQIIADYLFNKEEDKQMNEIIKNIQVYELEAVKLEKVAKLDSEKEIINGLKSDLPLEESPNTSGTLPQNADISTLEDEQELTLESESNSAIESELEVIPESA